MKKRILSLLLVAVMSIGLLSATAYAAENEATVTITNGTITVTNGEAGSYLVTILGEDGNAIGLEVVTVGSDGTGTKTTLYTDAAGVDHSIPGTGDGTTFSPNDPCLRAQIVTFLYRCMGE